MFTWIGSRPLSSDERDGEQNSYVYRRSRMAPLEASASSDGVTISGDGANSDLGYPSTVELQDGTLLTAWYEQMSSHPRAVLRLAKWSLL